MDSENSDNKDGMATFLSSHIDAGLTFQKKKRYREAIEEFEKEHSRPIKSTYDADVVQSSYWFKGRLYQEIGDINNAVVAYQKARALFVEHNIGSPPHDLLAEIYIEMGRYEDAIQVCQELLDKFPAWPTKQLLAKAIQLKGGSENT